MSLLDHLVLLLMAVLLPVNQYLGRAQLRRMLYYNTSQRIALYRQIAVAQWGALGVFLALWLFQGRPLGGLGFVLRFDAGFWAGLVLAATGLAVLQAYYRRQRADDTRRRKAREAADRLAPFLPRTPEAMPAFNALAVSAGICEEVLYRGFFLWYASRIFGTDLRALVISVVVTSLVFALGHVYQGTRGIVMVFLTGIVHGAIYAISGSLWIPIALHAGIDLLGGRAARELHPEGDPTPLEAEN